MTTIAYRDGILAADSLVGRGGIKCQGAKNKLRRMKDGSVAAGCGTLPEINAFIDWIEAGKKGARPALTESTVVHMRMDGAVEEHWTSGSTEVHGDFEAWGSGSEAALGALWAGLSAEEACLIGCKVDKSSGEPVFTMRVEAPCPAKKKRKGKKTK